MKIYDFLKKYKFFDSFNFDFYLKYFYEEK